MTRRINEGHPPSTGEWNEFEARQPEVFERRRRAAPKPTGRRGPDPLPMLTDAQIARKATWIHARLVLLIDALDGEEWDGRWTNKLMSAWLAARNTVEDAATWKEDTNAVARQLDADAKEETAPAAGGSPQEGSGGEAGDA
jgi:hypothetical protein